MKYNKRGFLLPREGFGKIQKHGEYIQVYFPSPLDRQCCLCLCCRRNTTKGRRWRRRRREDRLHPSSFVAIVAGREREVGSRLYAGELSDDDDDDDADTGESSPQGRESFHALVSTKACCVNSPDAATMSGSAFQRLLSVVFQFPFPCPRHRFSSSLRSLIILSDDKSGNVYIRGDDVKNAEVSKFSI